MIRKVLCLLALFALGCQAQNPVSPDELNRRIEWQVRQLAQLPAYINVRVVERKAGGELPGYDTVTVAMSSGEHNKTIELLISKDNKTLLSVHKMDLTVDVLAADAAQRREAMSKIDLKGRPIRGNKDAKVTVVVFDDYQCPYCSKFHRTLLDTLAVYGDRIKVIYKDFPLTEIHPWAERAAIDSQCLASQNGDAYWEFVDGLHLRAKEIAGPSGTPLLKQIEGVDRFATIVGAHHNLDVSALSACIQQQPSQGVQASLKEGLELGLEGAPAVFIDGDRSDGAIPDEDLRVLLNEALTRAGVALPSKSGTSAPANAVPASSAKPAAAAAAR
jgi:protein-disulfide isomerase